MVGQKALLKGFAAGAGPEGGRSLHSLPDTVLPGKSRTDCQVCLIKFSVARKEGLNTPCHVTYLQKLPTQLALYRRASTGILMLVLSLTDPARLPLSTSVWSGTRTSLASSLRLIGHCVPTAPRTAKGGLYADFSSFMSTAHQGD